MAEAPQAGVGPKPDRVAAILGPLAVLVAVWWASSVAMPIAFALFAGCILYPVFALLCPRIGRGAAALAVLLCYLLIIAALIGLTWYSGERIAAHQAAVTQAFATAERELEALLDQVGMSSASGSFDGGHFGQRVADLSSRFFDGLGATVLAGALLLLGYLELGRASALFERWDREDGRQRMDNVKRLAQAFRRYFAVRTVVGAVTGVAVWAACMLLGIQLAVLWGVLNFILNYFPTVGSLIAVIPPVLFAMRDGDLSQGGLALAAVGGVQLLMGSVIDPLAQGRVLRCSSTLILVAVLGGGFIGGLPGAFLGVPALIALRIAGEAGWWPGRRVATAVGLEETSKDRPVGV